MFRTTSRLAIIALTLGLLLVTPLVGLAAGLDTDGGHRSSLNGEEPGADYASLERLSLIEQLARDGALTADSIKFIEENVFELETVARFQEVPTAYEAIQALFDTDHVTLEMIEFYEQNFWN